VHPVLESKELLRIAVRCTLGVEPCDISLLYFLTYVSSAGGVKPLTEATPYTAQEYTVQVPLQNYVSLDLTQSLEHFTCNQRVGLVD